LVACLFSAGPFAAFGAERTLSDDDVMANLHSSMMAWRNHINKGDVSASPFYMPGASLYAELGPAANFLYFDEKLKNPLTVRGTEAISQFWNKLVDQVGLRELRVFEMEGPFTCEHLVVSDNEVILSGPFEFNSIRGRFLSMTWVRPAGAGHDGQDSWKMQSQMLTIEKVRDLKTLEHRANSSTDLAAFTADRIEEKEKVGDQTGAMMGGLDPYHPVAPFDLVVPPVKPADAGSTSIFDNFLWSLVGIAMIGCAIYLWKRNRNRRNLSLGSGARLRGVLASAS